jgi:hypothetical protein
MGTSRIAHDAEAGAAGREILVKREAYLATYPNVSTKK